jgi:hypothetical protein
MRKVKLFVIYFPVALVALQVIVNLLSFAINLGNAGFYINTFIGTNVLFSLFLLAFTFMFRFCAVSRWAAVAEVLFGLNYLIVQQDNLYNIMFQIIVGTLAIVATFWHYVKKFPLCRLSLLFGFIGSVAAKGSCKKGLDKWERDVKSIILKHHVHSNKS